MTISVGAIQTFLENNSFVKEGSQESIDAAMELLGEIRAASRPASDQGRKTYNVHDYLKSLSVENINEELDKSRSNMVSVFTNLVGDFNLSSGLRNSNWFNQKEVWIVGRRKWDRRGAVGTQNYTPVKYERDVISVIHALRNEGYTIVAAEITDNAVPLTTYEWNEKTAVIYGEEGAGLSQEVLDNVDDVVYIPGRGSVRSLNVATTSGIFSYDYHAKRGYINK